MIKSSDLLVILGKTNSFSHVMIASSYHLITSTFIILPLHLPTFQHLSTQASFVDIEAFRMHD
jgi:hypothetical protein